MRLHKSLLPLLLAGAATPGCAVLPVINYGRAYVTQPVAVEVEANSTVRSASGGVEPAPVTLAGPATEWSFANVLVLHNGTLRGTSREPLANGGTLETSARVKERGLMVGYPVFGFPRLPRTENSLPPAVRRGLSPVSVWATAGAMSRTGTVTERVADAAGATVRTATQGDDGLITFRTGLQLVVRPGALLMTGARPNLDNSVASLLYAVKVRGDLGYDFSPRNETIQSDVLVRDPAMTTGLRAGLGLYLGF